MFNSSSAFQSFQSFIVVGTNNGFIFVFGKFRQ